MSDIKRQAANPAEFPAQNNLPEKGWLSNIAGKSFALVSVAALTVPLLGMGQALDVAPGDLHSDTYEFDVRHKAVQMIKDFNTVSADHDAASSTYYLGRNGFDSRPFDTDISFSQGLSGLALAAATGALGSLFGNSARRKIGYMNEEVQARIDDRYDELYQLEQERFLEEVVNQNDIGIPLNDHDLGKLVLLDDDALGTLPDWVQHQTYRAQRDIALAAIHDNFSKFAQVNAYGDQSILKENDRNQLEIFKEQRDQAYGTLQDCYDIAARRGGSTLVNTLANGATTGAYLPNTPQVSANMVMAGVIMAGGGFYLPGKSVYDNFFRKNPELKQYEEPGRPELLSATDDLRAARKTLDAITPRNMSPSGPALG